MVTKYPAGTGESETVYDPAVRLAIVKFGIGNAEPFVTADPVVGPTALTVAPAKPSSPASCA